jgi:hypothetical protein
VQTGVHSQHFFYNNSHSLEPRLGLDWNFAAKQSLSFGYGYHSQLQPLFYYFIQTHIPKDHSYIKTNTEMEFTKSNHWVVGYDYLFSQNLRFKSEVYYQRLFDIPTEKRNTVFSMANVGSSFYLPRKDSLVNEGTGQNYGLEITLEKFLSRNYYFLVTASLFESVYTNNNVTRNTAFNGNYVANALGGYEFRVTEKGTLNLNVRVVTSGGRRVIPIDVKAEKAENNSNETQYDYDRAYEEQLDPYFRVDFRIGYKRNGKNITQEWAFDITNLTDHKNVFSRSWDEDQESYNVNYQQGFMPVGLYRINF